jgi:two-component system cell cycle sensor histidine kinase/response regulator CckA
MSTDTENIDAAMEMTSRLATNIAHELNNLLTPITVCGQMLREDSEDPESIAFCAEQVTDSGARIQALAKKLQLIGSRRANGGTTRPHEVLPGVIDKISQSLAREPAIRIKSSGLDSYASTPIAIDPEQFSFMVEELLRNAAEAMPQGGDIDLTLKPAAKPDRIELSVKDCGTGMDAEVRAKIFEPFFSTRTKGRDRGIGLSILYGVVRRAGGSVRVESSPGQGSLFSIELPLQTA